MRPIVALSALACLMSFALPALAVNAKHYVDLTASGANDGTSWSNAFTSFQSALDVAVAGDSVFVATGTYKPSKSIAATPTNRTRTFTLSNGVVYYGGYPTGGGPAASRSFTTNRTILSGDIGTLNDSTDNCFVVVNASDLTGATVMNGFTVEEGNADSTLTYVMYGRAGGIHLGTSGYMRIESMTIRDNYGRNGSGIYAESPVGWVLQDCSFDNNTDASAIYIGGTSSAALTNCSFNNNRGYNGGAISLNVLTGAAFTFTGCSFTGNVGAYSGGGGAISAGAAANTFTNCSFTNNTSLTGPGGALHKFYATLNTFSYCTFTGNSAGSGGALYGQGGFALDHCTFTGNYARNVFGSQHGGAIYNNGTPSNISNTVFRGNYTQLGTGGAIYNNTGGTVNLTNCTFTQNNAGGFSQGGGLNNNSTSNATINNCIFWGNTANGSDAAASTEIVNFSGSLTVANTIWQGNTSGGSIINADPLFTNAAAGVLTLQDCSPAIDTGASNSLTNDLAGNPRPYDAFAGGLSYDLGAYERQTTPLIPEANVIGNATSIADEDATASTTDHTDFGSSTTTRSFTIENTGTANLMVSSITVGGTNAANFSVSGITLPASIVPNSSTSFTLTFTSATPGVRTAVVHVNNNDCNEADYNFSVQATLLCTTPAFTCPANIAANTVGNTCAVPATYSVSPTGLPAPTLSYVFTGATTGFGSGTGSGASFTKGITTVQLTATNSCGSSSCSFTVNVTDVGLPVLSNLPANVTVSCNAVPTPTPPTATDNCDASPTLHYLGQLSTQGTNPSLPSYYNYTLTRGWDATDAAGNHSLTATQFITVQDIVAPVLSAAPAGTTVSCNNVPLPVVLTATDNCDANPLVTFSQTSTQTGSGAGLYNYIITRTWTATDGTGLSSSRSQTITVQDLVSPTITGAPASLTVSCNAIPLPGLPTATDNCDPNPLLHYLGEVSTKGTNSSVSSFYNYTLTRSWDFTDVSGNHSSIITQVITVQDITAPSLINFPGNTTVSCSNVPAPQLPGASDNCDANPIIHFLGEISTKGSDPTLASYYNYGITRSWDATDGSGNHSSVGTQMVNVQDFTAPTLAAVPANTTVSCDAVPAPGSPTASDNCDAAPQVHYHGQTSTKGSDPLLPSFYNYTITRKWDATDATLNHSAVGTQVITVQDITKPVLVTVPASLIVACNAIPAVGSPAASDNCDAAPVVHYLGGISTKGANPAQPAFYNYTITRTWNATDAAGNTSLTGTQIVTVQDVTAPVLSGVPAAATVSCSNVPAPATPTAADACDANPSVTLMQTSTQTATGIGHYNYTITRTWTATDASSNSSTGTQIITVQDLTAPVLASVPPAAIVSCNAIPSVGTPTATDNCDAAPQLHYLGEVSTKGATATQASFYNYTLTRSWDFTDVAGNHSAIATQVITVQDVAAPTLTVPANATVSCGSIPAPGNATATDNCDAAPVVHYSGQTTTQGNDPTQPDFYNYTITRTWNATDAAGNTSLTGTQIITVQDVTAPVLSGVPAAATVSCSNIPAPATPTATDACDAAPGVTLSTSSTQTATGIGHYNYTITRTWTATDASNKSSTASQVITVQDITAPTLAGVPAAVTVSTDAIPAAGTPTATDNCDNAPVVNYLGEVSTKGSNPALSTYYNYTITRKWDATDVAGNHSLVATQIITVHDIVAPTVVTQTVSITLVNGTATLTPAMVNFGSTDNSAAPPYLTYSLSKTSFNCSNIGSNTVTLTVTDPSGNSASSTVVVTIAGTIPVASITAIPANNTYTGGSPQQIYIGYGPQSATLSSSTSSGSGYTYSWSPATYLSASNVANPVFTPTTSATITYTLTATNGSGCAVSGTITMCALDVQVPGSNGKKINLCHAPLGNMSNTQALEITTTSVASHLSGHSGDRLGACDQIICSSQFGRSMPEPRNQISEQVLVYPNPNTGSFTVSMPYLGEGSADILITDVSGKTIQKRTITDADGNKISFNLGDVARGIYFIEVSYGDQRFRSKISVR
jgi:hypothetical protein